MRQAIIDDRYTLLDALGEGGMARVYLARDEVLSRHVALKVLWEQYADDEAFVERFRHEARSAASLNHSSIVQVYDQGRAQGDGPYYIAMEYVPGGTLKERIKREGPLDHRVAAGVALQIAEALDAAHASGIVHRDIKPQNVLLSASGEAKVADFGIALAVSSKTVTETNLVLGTSAYMSPEQVRGERAGPASDLYSLGVVLYEMLTGEQPYRAGSSIATAMKHLGEPVPHPRQANPAIPEGLDALVVKLLAKNPTDRYASARALAEDLRRARDGLMTPLEAGFGTGATTPLHGDADRTAPTVAAAGRAPGVPKRRRGLLPLIAALLALIGGVTWSQLQGPLDHAASGVGSHEQAENPEVDGSVRNVPVQAAPPASPAGGQVAEKRSEGAADEREKKPDKKPKKAQKGPRKPRAFFGSPFSGDLARLLPEGRDLEPSVFR